MNLFDYCVLGFQKQAKLKGLSKIFTFSVDNV
jgi:hypothetical protein